MQQQQMKMVAINNSDFFIPFDPRNGLVFKRAVDSPTTGLYELREDGELKILTREEFEKLKLIMAPTVRWIIFQYANALSYHYALTHP